MNAKPNIKDQQINHSRSYLKIQLAKLGYLQNLSRIHICLATKSQFITYFTIFSMNVESKTAQLI